MEKFIKDNKLISVLLVISLIISISYSFTENEPEMFNYANAIFNFSSQLSIAYVSSFIFYIVVSYIPDVKEKRKYQKIAFKQLRYSLEKHLDLLVYMYRATIIKSPNKKYISVSDIFDDFYYNEMILFDANAKVDGVHNKNWFEYIHNCCLEFANSLENTVEKYSIYLDDSTIDLIESIRHSVFMQLFLLKVTVFTKKDNRILIDDDFIESSKKDNKSLLIFESNISILKEHINLILELIELCNKENDKTITTDGYKWDNGTFPMYGDARFNRNIENK